MKKKDILGNGWLSESFKYISEMKKIEGNANGYSAIQIFQEGTKVLYTTVYGKHQPLSGEGYKWLTYLSLDECWALTMVYNPVNEIIGWYFDISKRNYLDENGIPCRDDIYLDLIIMPDGQTMTKDADELQEALDSGEISMEDYRHAYNIRDQILAGKWNNITWLNALSDELLSAYSNATEKGI